MTRPPQRPAPSAQRRAYVEADDQSGDPRNQLGVPEIEALPWWMVKKSMQYTVYIYIYTVSDTPVVMNFQIGNPYVLGERVKTSFLDFQLNVSWVISFID